MAKVFYDRETRHRMVADMYQNGYTDIEIAEEMGYKTTEHVKVILRKMGMLENESAIDVPKVLALKKAGWSMGMIVQEFGRKYTQKEISSAVIDWQRRRNGRPDCKG